MSWSRAAASSRRPANPGRTPQDVLKSAVAQDKDRKKDAEPRKVARLCPNCTHFKELKCELIAAGQFTEDDCGIWTANVKKLPFFEPKIPDDAPFPIAQKLPQIGIDRASRNIRSEEHTSELQSLTNLVCR